MRIFTVWNLLIGLFPASCTNITDDSCYVSTFWLIIGRCEEVSGPRIKCSSQLLEQLALVQQQLQEHVGVHLGDNTTYSDIKKLLLARTQLETPLNNFYSFITSTLAHHPNVSSEICVSEYLIKRWTRGERPYWPTGYINWIDYYFPVLGGFEFIFGMLGNLMIVVIYTRYQGMRSGPNKVILNLAIGDMFLLSNIILYYIRHRWMSWKIGNTLCRMIPYLRTVGIAVSVYSMVVLSMLKFFITASEPGGRTQSFVKKTATVLALLFVVWFLAALTGMPDLLYTMYFCELRNDPITTYSRFICLCLLPLTITSAFTVATSRILHRSVPGVQTLAMLNERRSRQRAAKVILSFVVVFCVTHLPLNIFYLVGSYYAEMHYRYAVQLLIALNSCLNPVGLFIGSSKFRAHLKGYFVNLWCSNSVIVTPDNRKTENVSVETTDTTESWLKQNSQAVVLYNNSATVAFHHRNTINATADATEHWMKQEIPAVILYGNSITVTPDNRLETR